MIGECHFDFLNISVRTNFSNIWNVNASNVLPDNGPNARNFNKIIIVNAQKQKKNDN